MGFWAKTHRFHEAGDRPNDYNVAEYGVPSHSLYTTSKVLSLHHRIDITDDRERVVYQAQTKFPSLHDKTDIVDAEGKPVAHIEKKILTLHQRHFVTMADGLKFELASELFHLVKDIINLEGLGWQLRGNILALNFELVDEQERPVAVIGQKMLSLHDKYCMDIYQPELEGIVVAIVITLQHMIRDRENSASFSSSSGSSNN